ncbi:hypothetical protein C8F04DRAFT_537289 [Mycena alexandri]|uniref:Uncharacterized protein n=1 Tax=Mycena alexandri TaxID=1745969 RepID=A0AAD6X1F9_9AGAR|nr:hypothetical protein C8F04DRAFT_537289 [Mycena alexandri]
MERGRMWHDDRGFLDRWHVAPRYRLCFTTPHATPRYVRLRPLPTPFDQPRAPSAHIQYDAGEHTLRATFDVGSGVHTCRQLGAEWEGKRRAGGRRKVDRLDHGRCVPTSGFLLIWLARFARPGPNSRPVPRPWLRLDTCIPTQFDQRRPRTLYTARPSISNVYRCQDPTSIPHNRPSTSAAASALAANSPQNGREINGLLRMQEGRWMWIGLTMGGVCPVSISC